MSAAHRSQSYLLMFGVTEQQPRWKSVEVVLVLKVSSSHVRFEKFANGFGIGVLLTRLDDRLSSTGAVVCLVCLS